MLVRKLKKEEIHEHRILEAVANGVASNRTDEEELERIKKTKDLLARNYFNRYVVFNDEGTMVSTMLVAPYKAYFDKNIVDVSAIGLVATLPEHRHNGSVRESIKKALLDMYDEKKPFSYLYPFSSAYYKKFGYALVAHTAEIEVKLHRLSPCKTKGTYERIEKNIEPCKEVYEKMCQKINMLAHRPKEDDWYFITDKNCHTSNEFTYLYRDENGTPKSYFIYKPVTEGENKIISCSHVSFYDREGFEGIIDFLLRLGGNFNLARIPFPADINVDSLIPEQVDSAIKITIKNNGMARAVHIHTLLSNASFKESGKVIIKINDDIIEENNAIWSITFENGKLKELKKTDEPYFAEMTIEIFTALILGRYDFSDADLISGLSVIEENSDAEKIFYKKKIANYEYF